MNAAALVLTVFVACAVEAVEALTIVLAAGLTRDWRSTFQGMAVALVVLAAVVAAVGPALTLFPLSVLRLVVGALLAVFGLQWLRKAALRASGYQGLHDETSIYARQVEAARAAAAGGRHGVNDWYAFTLSFNGDLEYQFGPQGTVRPYAGGGLSLYYVNVDNGGSDSNLGVSARGERDGKNQACNQLAHQPLHCLVGACEAACILALEKWKMRMQDPAPEYRRGLKLFR